MTDDFKPHRVGDLDDLSLLPRRFDALVNVVEVELRETLGGIRSTLDSINGTMRDVLAEHVNIYTSIGRVEVGLDKIRAELHDTGARVDRRFVALEERVARLEKVRVQKVRVARRRAARTKAKQRK